MLTLLVAVPLSFRYQTYLLQGMHVRQVQKKDLETFPSQLNRLLQLPLGIAHCLFFKSFWDLDAYLGQSSPWCAIQSDGNVGSPEHRNRKKHVQLTAHRIMWSGLCPPRSASVASICDGKLFTTCLTCLSLMVLVCIPTVVVRPQMGCSCLTPPVSF